MRDGGRDHVLEAFRRLLADAAGGGQAKVDALVALVQRSLIVATWNASGDGYRTLVNAKRDSALPVFTDHEQLIEAARYLGWLSPDGTIPSKEIGTREALRHVIAHDLQYLVIDITAPYALEIHRTEIEPLLTPAARRESTGPYAAVGRVSTSIMNAVKETPRPGTQASVRPNINAVPVPSVRAPTASVSAMEQAPRELSAKSVDVAEPPSARAATFGSGSSVQLAPLATPPGEELLDTLSAVLRGFPEVEWAAFCNASRGPTSAVPTVGLRVATSFRGRINDIIANVRQAGDSRGASLDVLLLDDPELMRTARAEALVFYPWRRRAG